jgi:uncharacterized protein
MSDPDPRLTYGPCPICGHEVHAAMAPFCSPRCKAVDMGRWLDEAYSFETPASDDELEGS